MPPPVQKNKSLFMRCILFGGGIMQGAFTSGGPLVVIYASRALTEKSSFRVTLCLLWLTLNSMMIIKWAVSGDVFTMHFLKMFFCILPFSGAGIIFGDFMHRRINERNFRLLVYSVLIGAAVMLGINQLLKFFSE